MIDRLRAAISLRRIQAFVCDALFLAGLAIVGYGISLWSQTAAICYAGLVLAALGFLNSPPNEPAR